MSDVKRQKRMDFDTRTKRQAALLTKLVSDPTAPAFYNNEGNRRPAQPPMSVLNSVSDRTAGVVNDLESLEQLLPDVELAAQILVSSILSPKDMGAPNLTFAVNSNFKDQELAGKLIKVISDYFTNDYRINEELSEILHDILFKKGSYIRMIVPESSLDQIINEDGRMSLESVGPLVNPADMTMRPLGLLGDGYDPNDKTRGRNDNSPLSMESLRSEYDRRPPALHYRSLANDLITVVDNPDAIKMPNFFDRIRKDRYKRRMADNHMTLEARKIKREKEKKKDKDKPHDFKLGSTDREIQRTLDNNRKHTPEGVVELKTRHESDRKTWGHPMVTHLSTEAVIPAHVPSNPRRHIGYFVLLDQYGNPISTATTADHYRYLQASFQKSTSENTVTDVLKELRGGETYAEAGSKVETIAQATQAFADIIERDLLARVRKGMGHESVELSRPNEVYQIMLSRTMRKKRTQVLFVPVELMSYMAFYHTNQGVGKSLLEESRVLASIRVMLMFANTMASIRNSTSRTELGITLDPNDTDPLSTIAMVKDAFMRSRSEQYPLGEGDPAAVIQYLQQAAVDVVYSGHEGLPEMRVETNDKSGNRTIIDRDLEERLRHQHIMSMGLSPETVDASSSVDFATTLVNSSLMLSKRVAVYQKKFEQQKSDFIRKYTENSEPLISKLTKIVEDQGDSDAKQDVEGFLEKFIEAIEVQLPRPDYVTLESHMQAFEQYTRMLEQAIDAWINDEFTVMDAEGDLANYLRELRSAIISHYQRRWLRENNVMPELEEMTEVDDKGKAVFKFGEIHGKHTEAIMSFVEDYLEKAREASLKREKRAEKVQERLDKKYSEQVEDGDSAADSLTGGSGGGETDTGGFDDETGGDELGGDALGDEDLGGGDTEASDEPGAGGDDESGNDDDDFLNV